MAGLPNVLNEFKAGWETLDVERLVACFTDDGIYEDVALGAVNQGKEAIRKFISDFVNDTVANLRVTIVTAFASGDLGGAQWTMSGTQKVDMPGIPNLGRRFDIRGASVLELRGDKIARNSDYWDLATLMRQLGALAMPEPAAVQAQPSQQG